MSFEQMIARFAIETKALWRRQGERNESVRKQLQEQGELIDDLRKRLERTERQIQSVAVNLADSVSESK